MGAGLLIAIPAYGGNVSLHTMFSVIDGMKHFEATTGVTVTFTGKLNEALIQRARNDMASKAWLKGFDKILFIDADIAFKKDWITRLWQHDKLVVGGSYPKKALPIKINLNVMPADQTILQKKPDIVMSDMVTLKAERGDEKGLVKVLHVPTGFLMIDTKVFSTLSTIVPGYDKTTYDFFPVTVNKQYGILESEDWGFCRLCQENGIDIHFDPDLICQHIGVFNFDPNLSPP
jgi:hypothetical protein